MYRITSLATCTNHKQWYSTADSTHVHMHNAVQVYNNMHAHGEFVGKPQPSLQALGVA